MPHEPGHNGQYVIKSTGEPYSGLVLHYAGKPYTTRTGAYEGSKSRELVLASEYSGSNCLIRLSDVVLLICDFAFFAKSSLYFLNLASFAFILA